MVKTRIFLLLFLLTYAAAAAQYRYMVFFKDKNGSTFAVDNPGEFLSQRAVDRRLNQGIAVTEQDLPVVSSYVEALRQVSGVTVLHTSKWFNGALVECDPSTTDEILLLSFVSGIEYAAPMATPTARLKSGRSNGYRQNRSSETSVQLSMIGVDQMQADGLRGEGILIAVMDSGFPGVDQLVQFQHLFDEGRIDEVTSYNFAFNRQDVYGYDPDGHGTAVLSIMAAYDELSFTGGAYKANYLLFVTEHVDTEYRVEEFNWVFAAERADSAGVDIINTSLGYNTFDDPSMDFAKGDLDGNTTFISRGAKIASSKGIVVVVAAGNEDANSWGTITAPADAEDILAVGAVTTTGTKTLNSSPGPSADGRIKPDVSALGSSVSVITSTGSVGHPSGTSVAAPLVTSLVAGVWQALPELTALEVMDTIRNTASRSNDPNNLIGFGIPSYYEIFQITSAEGGNKASPAVFPNPVARTLKVELSPQVDAITQVVLTPSSGARINVPFQIESSNQLTVDVSGFTPGFYVLQLSSDVGTWTYKLVKID